MRAAAVGGPAGDDAVAAAAEDAGPAGEQPGQVGADQVLGVDRVDELDPLAGKVEVDLPAARIVLERIVRLIPISAKINHYV